MVLKINQLSTFYKSEKKLFTKPSWNYAIKDVSLELQEGEVFAIVGESGCGKSTLGNTIAGLISPFSGSIEYRNEEIITPTKNVLKTNKQLRRKIQVIFQDPYSSLNPKHTIKRIIGSPLLIHKLADSKNYKEKVEYYLSLVHLDKKSNRSKTIRTFGRTKTKSGNSKSNCIRTRNPNMRRNNISIGCFCTSIYHRFTFRIKTKIKPNHIVYYS